MSFTTRGGFTVTKPSSAPTVSTGADDGLLDTSAVYGYKVTYVTAFGETDGSTAGTATTTSTASLSLSAIPVSSDLNVTSRKIYRTVGGGSSYLLLATIADNTTTTYDDIIADASLTTAIPTTNSAHSLQKLDGYTQFAKPALCSVTNSITAYAGGAQTNATQLTTEYNVITTVGTAADSVKLPELNSTLIGMRVVVINRGANSMNVFPYLAQDASGGTNTAVAVAAAAGATFVAVSATAWAKFV
jgi:hypothetical protein